MSFLKEERQEQKTRADIARKEKRNKRKQKGKRGKSSVSQTGASDHIYMYVALEKY